MCIASRAECVLEELSEDVFNVRGDVGEGRRCVTIYDEVRGYETAFDENDVRAPSAKSLDMATIAPASHIFRMHPRRAIRRGTRSP